MTREVEPGFPRLEKSTRPWVCKKEDPDCTRKVPCRSCLGRRSRRSGMTKQRAAKKTLERLTGTEAGRYSSQTGNEENWRLSIRAEVKSGKQVEPVRRKYEDARGQSDASKAVGDPRPFVFVAVPDGWPAGKCLYTIVSDEAEAFALAVLGELT